MGGRRRVHSYHGRRRSKKTVVEVCKSLDANRWMREGILKAGVRHSGGWAWFCAKAPTEPSSSIGYEVNTRDNPPWLRLSYTFSESQDMLDYRIHLETTRPRFGGLRWWFICPLVINGIHCGRRVGKLYRPPNYRYFGCRHCHELTYRSAQEHDKRVDVLCRNPQALLHLDPGTVSISQLKLALKAIRRMK